MPYLLTICFTILLSLDIMANPDPEVLQLYDPISLQRAAIFDAFKSDKSEKLKNSTDAVFNYLIGNLSLIKNDLIKAKEHMTAVIEADPTAINARTTLSVIAQLLGDFDLAERINRELLTLIPNSITVPPSLANILIARQEYDEAARLLEDHLRKDHLKEKTSFHKSRTILANIYGYMGELKQARQVLQPLFDDQNMRWQGHYMLGLAYANNKQLKKAITQFKKALQLKPDYLQAVLALSSGYTILKQPAKVNRTIDNFILTQIAGNGPPVSNPQTNNQLATRRFQFTKGFSFFWGLMPDNSFDWLISSVSMVSTARKGQLQIALAQLQLTRLVLPNNYVVIFHIAETLSAMDQDQEAAIYYRQIPPSAPSYLDSQVKVATVEADDPEKLQPAIQRLLDLLEQNPQSFNLILNLCYLLRKNKDFQKVVEITSNALESTDKNPNFVHLYFQRGIALDQLDRWPEAEQDFRKYLTNNPNDADALNYLGYTMADKNQNLDEALRLIKKASHIEPSDGYITDSVAWILYRMKRYEEALMYITEAIRMVPTDPTISDHQGDILHALGQTRPALTVWKRALSLLDPEERNYQTMKADIEAKIEQHSQALSHK